MNTRFEMELTGSRESMIEIITENMSKYMQTNVDFSKTRYFGYLINVLATLTSDEIFFCTMANNESFFQTATLPQAIDMLATYLSYKSRRAIPATGTLMISIPLASIPDGVEIIIGKDHIFYADDVKFKIMIGDILITKNHGMMVNVRLLTSEGFLELPPNVTEDEEGALILNFMVEAYQIYEEEYEYQVDPQLQPFQYFLLSNEIASGEIIDIKVFTTSSNIKPGQPTIWEEWEEYDSLYLMTSTTKGYITRIFRNELNITFGNGILGMQPNPSDKIKLVVSVTNGSNGNVVNNSINKSNPIFISTSEGNIQIPFTVLNPFNMTGGRDFESPESIKSNAPKAFKASDRLISSDDFNAIDAIIPEFPFTESYSTLKRSDLKTNEINIYNVLKLGDEIVPSRTDILYNVDKFKIKPFETFTIDDIDYYNIFEMNIDSNINRMNYVYVVNDNRYVLRATKEITPTSPRLFLSNVKVESKYIEEYPELSEDIFSITFNILKSDTLDATDVNLRLNITGFNYDYNEILSFQEVYKDGTVDNNAGKFTCSIPLDYVPTGILFFTALIDMPTVDGNIEINNYQGNIELKTNLNKIMFSGVEVHNETPTEINYDIYDVPLIRKDWYDNLSDNMKTNFENYIISKMNIPNALTDKRGMNLFPSLKFSNSTGKIKNIYINSVINTISKFVIDYSDIDLEEVSRNYKVIIKGPVTNPSDPFYDKDGYMARVINIPDESTEPEWEFTLLPRSSMIINVEDGLKYFYDYRKWYRPQLDLPIKLDIILYTTDGQSDIINTAKELILTYYGDIGHDKSFYRSKIIALMETLPRVKYVELIKPEIDIPYNYEVRDMSVQELMVYTPEYLYITSESIKITVRPYSIN